MKTRAEIKENRLKFAKGLQEPHREKEQGQLENIKNPNMRCCLGHGCEIFNIKREITEDGKQVVYDGSYAIAPTELMQILGLKSDLGYGIIHQVGSENYRSLASLNDNSPLTTQEIGKAMEMWIEGGENTPFIHLSEYSE